MNNVCLYGAGGHAYVIIEILHASGIVVDEIYDDKMSCPFHGNLPVLPGMKNSDFVRKAKNFIVSIGKNEIRKKVSEQLGAPFASAISSVATISPSAEIGPGSVVMQNAVIQAYSKIGRHVIVNTKTSIDHECVIGDFAHISPSATLCGNVTVGEGAWIGAGAVVIPDVNIGSWATVGAGSVVIRDVPDGATVVGNPANSLRK